MSTRPEIDASAIARYCNGCGWGLCNGGPGCKRYPYIATSVNTGNAKSEKVVGLVDADIPVDFSDALGRLRRANLAFVREVRRCHGEKPLGSAIKKIEYRVSDGSVAVIDDNGGLITFCCELGEDK